MKLLPEVPTKEMWDMACNGVKTNEELARTRKVLSIHEIRMLFDHFSKAMYAAAPDVKDEPVGYVVQSIEDGGYGNKIAPVGWMTFEKEKQRLEDEPWVKVGKARLAPLYAHPSPRIAALEAEVVKLQAQLAKARSDTLEEAAKICETTIEILYSMYGDGLEVESAARECAHAIRAEKEKP